MSGLAGLALGGLLATVVLPLAGLALIPAIRRHRHRRPFVSGPHAGSESSYWSARRAGRSS